MSVDSLKVQIIKKAWEDPAFKQLLLSDPKAALKQGFGIDVPDEIELKVVEETPTSLALVIPPNPEEVLKAEGNLRYNWV